LAIASGVTCYWPSTNASIPAGWTRVTALDGLYPKGTAAGVDPGGTGGALTHIHTTTAHNHTTAHTHTIPNSGTSAGTIEPNVSDTDAALADSHTHNTNGSTVNPTTTLANASPSTDAINHEPSNFVTIFIQSDGTPTGIPSNAVVLWNDAAGAPTNWNLCDGGGTPARPDIRARYLKGAAAGGDGGGTGGGLTHSHTIASHDHTTPYSHAHPNKTSAGPSATVTRNAGTGATAAHSTHTHVLTIASADSVVGSTSGGSTNSPNHEPPYAVGAFIQNNTGGASLPSYTICQWQGTLASIPSGWTLCDGTSGTPDWRGKFIKGATILSDIGGTGGSLTHGHTASGSHTHSLGAHAHGVTHAVGAGIVLDDYTSAARPSVNHTHTWANTGSGSGTSGAATPTVADYTDTQPPFYTVAYVQYQPAAPPAAGVTWAIVV